MHRISIIRVLALMIGMCLASAPAYSACGTDVVIVKGRVEHSPRGALVRVQLVYPKQRHGESGDVTVEDGRFTLQIPFLTQSHAPVLIGSLGEKCDRKPVTVVVKLISSDQTQEFERLSLDLKKDFKMEDPSAYAPRSEIVLSGIH